MYGHCNTFRYAVTIINKQHVHFYVYYIYIYICVFIERKMQGRIEVMRRRGRRRKQLLDDLKETRGYWKLKEEALDCILCRIFWKRLRTCRKTDYGLSGSASRCMYWRVVNALVKYSLREIRKMLFFTCI
jgi:hypothetical protein